MYYSKHYSKLDQKFYTTIRRNKKGKVGDIVDESYPGGRHDALIREVVRKTLSNISTSFLLEDTDCKTRQEAINLMQSFYENGIDIENEKLYIYSMMKK